MADRPKIYTVYLFVSFCSESFRLLCQKVSTPGINITQNFTSKSTTKRLIIAECIFKINFKFEKASYWKRLVILHIINLNHRHTKHTQSLLLVLTPGWMYNFGKSFMVGWLRSTVGRTPVFGRRTDPVLRLACSRRMTIIWVNHPLQVSQLGQLTQPFILSGSINE